MTPVNTARYFPKYLAKKANDNLLRKHTRINI